MRKLLYIMMLITCTFAMKNAVNVFLRDSEHNIPSGRDFLWTANPNAAPCSWTRHGIHYAVWMTDIESGETSSIFYPGDHEFNFEYYGPIKDDFPWGWFYFSLDNFWNKGRETPMEIEMGDIMHIRMMYQNPYTGVLEVWSHDTSFNEPPTPTGVDIYATFHEITKEDCADYECFRLTPVPEKTYFTPVLKNPSTYDTELHFGFTDSTHAIIEIRDIFGEKFRYTDKTYAPGQYKIYWNGLNEQNQLSKSGLYVFNMFLIDNDGERSLFSSRRLLYFMK